MKTMAVVAALSLTAILTGCGAVVETEGVRSGCSNEDVNVISVRGHLEVKPERVEVCPGNNVTLWLRNRVPSGDAQTKQQVGTNAPWLEKNNKESPDKIVLEVPKDAEPGTEFKYELEVKGIGMLDPVIVIR